MDFGTCPNMLVGRNLSRIEHIWKYAGGSRLISLPSLHKGGAGMISWRTASGAQPWHRYKQLCKTRHSAVPHIVAVTQVSRYKKVFNSHDFWLHIKWCSLDPSLYNLLFRNVLFLSSTWPTYLIRFAAGQVHETNTARRRVIMDNHRTGWMLACIQLWEVIIAWEANQPFIWYKDVQFESSRNDARCINQLIIDGETTYKCTCPGWRISLSNIFILSMVNLWLRCVRKQPTWDTTSSAGCNCSTGIGPKSIHSEKLCLA